MKVGLQIPDFSTPRGPEALGRELANVARTADDAGFEYIAVMDHFFQIPGVGAAEKEMLEAYTTLGYLAACTSRATLVTVMTGAFYREPGILGKIVTTLDVLSGGRAWLGIGAGWNEEESRGLGIRFPPLSERFERLEETLQICLQMWRGDEKPYAGKYYSLERPLNSPQSLSRPHPPIMIGGGGEKKTLRLVAQYADACNLFGDVERVKHLLGVLERHCADACNLFAGRDEMRKLDILRQHCEAVGRDYDTIYKTAYYVFDPSRGTQRIVDELGALAEAGFAAAIGPVANVWDTRPLEIVGSEVIPRVADF
jgi:F420-dependent oxidoreductase-like protein